MTSPTYAELREKAQELRKAFPQGSRVILVRMLDTQAPMPGTLGTVLGVDDLASILVKCDNGSRLSVAYGTDLCRRVDLDLDDSPQEAE